MSSESIGELFVGAVISAVFSSILSQVLSFYIGVLAGVIFLIAGLISFWQDIGDLISGFTLGAILIIFIDLIFLV